MSDFPVYAAAFVVVLGVLIVVHEFGHFLVARLCGVKVLRFSVGFGRPLWSRISGADETEWVLGAFPLGGYVKMLDEREGEVAPHELHRAFNRQGVGRRSAIVVAGPLANFLLAIVLYWGVFLAGSDELLPILGTPSAGSPAAVAGFANGELVRNVDGEAVRTWTDFRWQVLKKAVEQEDVRVEVIDEAGLISVRRLDLVLAGARGWEGDAFERLGLTFYRPPIPAVVGRVVPDSPGEVAGLKQGDRVLAIDGQVVDRWPDVVVIVRSSPGKGLRFRVARAGGEEELTVVPAEVEERRHTIGRIGVAPAESDEPLREVRTRVSYDFLTAGAKAIEETWDKSVFSLVMLGKMLTGEVSWRNLSGPVTIADYAGQSAKLGLDYYLKFMALVSISLGVLNLLPIPVLDGGHLMYHMIEVVRRGPLSERAMEIGQQIGLSLLLALMAFAFFNDINRLLSG
ncbi:MAG TPA: RIP metalloprotease RseP [Rhodocyclaceae bacterium]|nr:RIP metalloprotease RseP [Rhodocyclaceae bacterium]HMV19720.1 RIP metalloprotease RseP [Rhodocyclaceae bacterium]HMW76296.1 RIP metalloprotease RseP [Rhodocyclaceae bacterium]HNE42295.1 RIP metalloprotease RseP [Rhodocyclaceae bacterium]HNL20646.1 RIP metalloprotease RseP [Rhodocyclaceae bacterium]